MKHVLVLNQYALPRSQGGGTRHIDLFSRLPGWEPLIVAGGRNHYSQETFKTSDQRFRLVRVPGYDGNGHARILGWFVYALKAVATGLTRRHVDVVYASSPHMLAPAAGWLVARLRGAPFILEVRDLWPEALVSAGALRRGSFVHRLLTALEAWTARRAERIVVVTEGWEDHFAALGVTSSSITVIANGTEASDFAVADGRDELRRRESIEGFTAVFAGAHGAKDGIDHILDAASELKDVRFVLVGAGAAKADAVDRVQRECLGNVEFRHPVPKTQLPSLLAACDVGVHAVTPLSVFAKGMSPNKLFDYMAAGLPVVSNAAEALDRVMVDGQCGRLGAADELADCLRDVQRTSARQRAAWAERGRDLVATRFSRTAAAVQLRGVLDEVTRRDRPTARTTR